ncbi:hypothetical protein AAF712_012956 [Marasmius tenuissimus]|uniref:Uncharacterized protein n=1 Tax=Marasmius tenuissimus TaxID=585030 RepID=A0ABR2ZF36_9AGAR
MPDVPKTPSTGCKPIRRVSGAPSQPLEAISPSAPATPVDSTMTQSKKNKRRSNAAEPVLALQTRSSNKEKHPGLAQKALDMVRRSSEAVQAEKEQKKAATEAAENQRIKAKNRLAAFEDTAQKAQDNYKKTFAQPSVPATNKGSMDKSVITATTVLQKPG